MPKGPVLPGEPPTAAISEDAQARAVSLTRIADTALRSGDLDSAVGLFQEATLTDGRNLPAALGLGNALLVVGHGLEATKAFERALAIQPASPEARYGYARAMLSINRPEVAADNLRAMVATSPNDIPALNALGVARTSWATIRRPSPPIARLSRSCPAPNSWRRSGAVAGLARLRRGRGSAPAAGRRARLDAPIAAESRSGVRPPGRHGWGPEDQPHRPRRRGSRQQSRLLCHRSWHGPGCAARRHARPGERCGGRAAADPQEQERGQSGSGDGAAARDSCCPRNSRLARRAWSAPPTRAGAGCRRQSGVGRWRVVRQSRQLRRQGRKRYLASSTGRARRCPDGSGASCCRR